MAAGGAKSGKGDRKDSQSKIKSRVAQGFDSYAPKPKAKPAVAKAKAKSAPKPKAKPAAPAPKKKPARETMAMKRAMGSGR